MSAGSGSLVVSKTVVGPAIVNTERRGRDACPSAGAPFELAEDVQVARQADHERRDAAERVDELAMGMPRGADGEVVARCRQGGRGCEVPAVQRRCSVSRHQGARIA
jgi:hypothetical protein